MHFLVHEGGNGNDYKCGMCNQFFMEPGLMRKHVRTFHISEKEYKCDPCDKVFPILVDFKIHKWYFTTPTVTLLNCSKFWSSVSHISSDFCTIFCK